MLKYSDDIKVLESQIIAKASEKLSKEVEAELSRTDPTPESAKAALNENEVKKAENT
jgi:hypothetical protein